MKGKYANVYALRGGTILSKYSIISTVIMLFIALGTIFSAFYYMVAFVIAVCAIVFTFGLIFLTNPDFIKNMFSGGDALMNFAISCQKALSYLWAISAVCAVTSVVLLFVQKEKRSTARIVFTIISGVIAMIIGFVIVVGGVGR